MKRLLLQVSIFSIFTIIVLFLLFLLIRFDAQKMRWTITSKSQPKNLFIGDSHVESAIDDKLLPNTVTIAESGDAYLYSFVKLRNLLNDNSSIESVYLSIDYHNIDKTCEEWYSGAGYLAYKMPLCIPWMDILEIKDLFNSNPIGFIKGIPNIFSKNAEFLVMRKFKESEFGSYKENLTICSKDSLNLPYTSNYRNILSELQLYYLNKISKFCISKNVVLNFITLPVHKSCLYNSVLQNAIQEYSKSNWINYYDSRNFPLSDSCFIDRFHLNSLGAFQITKVINKQIH